MFDELRETGFPWGGTLFSLVHSGEADLRERELKKQGNYGTEEAVVIKWLPYNNLL